MALSDEARKRLVIALTDSTVGAEVADAVDAGQDEDVLADLASTATGVGASMIGIEDAGTLLTATDVEAALAELAGGADVALRVDLASVANGDGASLVAIEDAALNFTAENVEAALAELAGVDNDTIDGLASTATGFGASWVGVEDAGSLLAAADVEAALLELVKYVPVPLADPGTGVAIPVTRSASVAITTGAAETNTLAAPSFIGQKMLLTCDVYAVGDRVVTSAVRINQAGNTVMTFGEAGDSIVLEAVQVGGALVWQVTSNDGVALGP
jgi:hypothetical protein